MWETKHAKMYKRDPRQRWTKDNYAYGTMGEDKIVKNGRGSVV
jgi:hypothetical protein